MLKYKCHISYLQANYPYDEHISMGHREWSEDALRQKLGKLKKYRNDNSEGVIHLVKLTQFLETETLCRLLGRDSCLSCTQRGQLWTALTPALLVLVQDQLLDSVHRLLASQHRPHHHLHLDSRVPQLWTIMPK